MKDEQIIIEEFEDEQLEDIELNLDDVVEFEDEEYPPIELEDEINRAETYKIIIETMNSVKGVNTRERLLMDVSDKIGLSVELIDSILNEFNTNFRL